MNTTETNRAHLYRFLSSTFAYPNEGFISLLRKNLEQVTASESPSGLKFSQVIDLFEKEPLQKLQAEYTRLFITGYPRTPCPPYESVYREKQLLGKSNQEVQTIYREWGMSVDARLADHLATEFEFLAFLCFAAALSEISDKAKKAERSFSGDHLQKWAPQFAADLQNNAGLEGYKALGEAIGEFVAEISDPKKG
jgi:putative dimethyl sulfoxide reductase chaperone